MAALHPVRLPVAASRSGGTPDLIEDGVNGLLFDPYDAESIRAALLKLFTDEGFATKIGSAARLRALQRHHPIRIAERHLEIYRDALEHAKAE